jgi:transcriptional regulator with XRE-family HTH domain
MKQFHDRLREEMSRHNMTLTDLAGIANDMSVPHLCHILQGDRNPSLPTLQDLVRALPKANVRKLLLGE